MFQRRHISLQLVKLDETAQAMITFVTKLKCGDAELAGIHFPPWEIHHHYAARHIRIPHIWSKLPLYSHEKYTHRSITVNNML